MKKLLILFVVISFGINVFAQSDEVKPVVYEDIITVDSVDKNELYNRAKLCIVSIYKNANQVIQLDDQVQGTIVCKGKESRVIDRVDNNISYTLSIFVKDGRYKYIINDIVHSGGYYSRQIRRYKDINFGPITTAIEPVYRQGAFKKAQLEHYNDVKSMMDQTAKTLISGLQQAMSKETISNDNW